MQYWYSLYNECGDNLKSMTFKQYGDSAIRINLFQKTSNSGDGVSFVATYPDKDIWGDGNTQPFGGTIIFCFKKEISRSEWAELGHGDHTQAVLDFKDAIEMFSSGNFKHPVTQYFLNLMMTGLLIKGNSQEFLEYPPLPDEDSYTAPTAPEDTLYFKGDALSKIGKYQEAIDVFDEVLKIDPQQEFLRQRRIDNGEDESNLNEDNKPEEYYI